MKPQLQQLADDLIRSDLIGADPATWPLTQLVYLLFLVAAASAVFGFALNFAGVFIFLESWNEFLFSSVLISSRASQTFPVGLYSVAGTYGDIRWGETMAAAAVGTIPVFTLFLAFQRWLVSGLTSGAVKG